MYGVWGQSQPHATKVELRSSRLFCLSVPHGYEWVLMSCNVEEKVVAQNMRNEG